MSVPDSDYTPGSEQVAEINIQLMLENYPRMQQQLIYLRTNELENTNEIRELKAERDDLRTKLEAKTNALNILKGGVG